jgi:hypothetical protein
MKSNFQLDTLSISLSRQKDKIVMFISSDYAQSSRKSALYVNEKSLATNVQNLWKSIKTKKLLAMSASFGEIDWYSDETNVYYVPNFQIKRGLKKVRVGESEHWSIPKDWSFDMSFLFADTSTITPLMEVVKATLGSKLSAKAEKSLIKEIRPFVQKKAMYANFESEEEEQRTRSYW